MLTQIIIGLVLIVVVLVIVVATRPSSYTVTRSVTVAVPADVVFTHVNELKKWEAWNPWGKVDPAMKMTYEGPPSGVGAAYSWVGNSKVGEGRMTVTESRPNTLIRFRLEFYKPMAGVSTSDFTFKPEGRGTVVTWAMAGDNNFIAKAFGLIMSMDKMIGGQFERGLADLKSVAEAAGKR